MSRPTKQLTTPSGHEVTIYSYITGREFLEMNQSVKAAGITIEGDKITGASDSFLDNINSSLSKTVVSVKLAGTEAVIPQEKCKDAVLDMELRDYMFVVENIAELVEVAKKKGAQS